MKYRSGTIDVELLIRVATDLSVDELRDMIAVHQRELRRKLRLIRHINRRLSG